MSIGPTYVRASDDNFYKDAFIQGEDFFICFDEDEDPELVIMEKGRSQKELTNRADQIIRELKLKATIKENNKMPGYNSERCFNNNQPLSFKPAFSVYLDITKPIPVDLITRHEGLYEGKGEGTFECFEEMDFPEWRKQKFGEKE